MKKYFYSDGNDQFGPFNLEELKEKKISRETLVWFEGMEDWQKAKDVEEVKSIFVVIPPPIKKVDPPPLKKTAENIPPSVQEKEKVVETNASIQEVKKPKSKKTRNILIIIFSVIILAVAAILIINYYNNKEDDSSSSSSSTSSSNSDNSSNQEHSGQKTEQELKTDLRQTEESNPTKYLSVSGKWWLNFSNSTVIEGDIYSSATLATFKDVNLKVEFLSQTGTILGTDYFTVYQYVSPGRSAHFKQKFTYFYKNGKGLNWYVVGATASR
jgi:hypothetical protein